MLPRSQSLGIGWTVAPATLTLLLSMWLVGCLGDPPVTRVETAEENDPGTPSSAREEAGPAAERTADALPADTLRAADSVETGQSLYARHCAACHGERGDGQGIAATYLYPKPRDFRAGRFRLVSTVNRTPSPDDLLSVLRRGMPGSSMPPWDHLSDYHLAQLVAEVQRLHRDGTREQYTRILSEDEELSEEEIRAADVQEEIEDYVKDRTAPSEATAVPEIAPADAAALARGKELYIRQACNKCHGDTGRGDGQQAMVDDEGYPMTPRDFTAGIFKGEDDPASIYRRIAYGMPGTPMPSSQLTAREIIDLSQFVLSLSDEETRRNARLRRHHITAERVNRLPAEATDTAWDEAAVTTLRMTPLWWRDEAHPVIEIQAVHDGQTIALRLSWPDETQDLHALTSGHFEDAVAVELFQGDKEPFVGMGAPNSAVDVWYWDADRQTAADVEDQYPNVVVDIYPYHERQVDTPEGRRPSAASGDQPDISLPAVASGNPIVPGAHVSRSGGSVLSAGGPQTITFRMPNNQAVDAHGEWIDGRWSVVMKRALQAPGNDGGVSLVPGESVSIAFAVFNGARNDRDGQKLITVWNDLTLNDQ